MVTRSIHRATAGTIGALAAISILVGCASTSPSPFAVQSRPAPSRLLFRDRAADVGLTFQAGTQGKSPLNISELMGGAAAWLDYDGDGWEDLILGGPTGLCCYRNLRGERFLDATHSVGLPRTLKGVQGLTVGDVDGDGHPDLFVGLLSGARLFRLRAGGRFVDATTSAGIRLGRWVSASAFADVDGDGDLDLYAGRYLQFSAAMPQFHREGGAQLTLGPAAYEADRGDLLLNDGAGRFHVGTGAAGLSGAHGKTLGVIFGDSDGDGDADLYLANDEVACDFFVNDGKGHFRNDALRNGTALSSAGTPQAGMGVDWVDYDGDGAQDLVVTTFWSEPTSLYRRLSEGLYEERSLVDGLAGPTTRWTGFGIAFEDLDNDGQMDLMQANGHVEDQRDRVDPTVGYRQPTQVFRSQAGKFSEFPAAVPAERVVGRALATADYDRDGRMDAVVASLSGPPVLLHNESTGLGHWLGVRLKGRGRNVEGIGSRVTVTSGSRNWVREVRRNRSYYSSTPIELRIGVGAAQTVNVRVKFASGRVREMLGLETNRSHEVVEE